MVATKTNRRRNRNDAWICTFTGKQFWPLSPRPEDVCIEDIAHSLSLKCRFSCHCKVFYSVAQHCYVGSYLVPAEHALWFLLHDAAEAYLCDVAGPIKPYLLNLCRIETRLQKVICACFGLPWPVPSTVKRMDKMLLAAELDTLINRPVGIEYGKWYPIAKERIADMLAQGIPRIPEYVDERSFLKRFSELGGVYKCV